MVLHMDKSIDFKLHMPKFVFVFLHHVNPIRPEGGGGAQRPQ